MKWDTGLASANFYSFNTGAAAFCNIVFQQIHSTGSATRMTIDSVGDVGIGITNPVYSLDISGSMLVRNGGGNTSTTGNQLLFGYLGSNNYMHSIKSRHDNATDGSGNAIDFYVWRTTDAINAIGTKQIMSVTSAGVGVGLSNPSFNLDVSGNIRSTSTTSNNIGGVTLSNTNLTLAGAITGSTVSSINNIGGVLLRNSQLRLANAASSAQYGTIEVGGGYMNNGASVPINLSFPSISFQYGDTTNG
jgi:hypothetical protein